MCRASGRRAQRPLRGSSETAVTWAPRMRGISATFGQTGVTTATLSHGSMSAWAAIIRALTPELVTARRSGLIGVPCRSER